MSNIFKKADIEAGHLLRVRCTDESREFNMTVVPSKGYKPGLLGTLFGVKPHAEGQLALCNPGRDWWPLDEFDDELKNNHYQVSAVYGRTAPQYLLANSTEGRELLWKRERAKAHAEEDKPEPAKRMTTAEIAEALGYPVEIVE